MTLAIQLQGNSESIRSFLYLGKARWEALVGRVGQAEQAPDTHFKDEQILTFLVCAAYAVAGPNGVGKFARLLSNGGVSTERIWFEVLAFPTRKREGNTVLDLAVGNISRRPGTEGGIQLKETGGSAIAFCECKWLSDISLEVSHDVHRNQMARVIENALLFCDARGRVADVVYFTLITPAIFKSRGQFSRLYQYKWREYQAYEMLRADLDSCSLEMRGAVPLPDSHIANLKLNWVTYEELLRAAPQSPLQAEVVRFFQRLSLAVLEDL
jgi:hypothetical protein